MPDVVPVVLVVVAGVSMTRVAGDADAATAGGDARPSVVVAIGQPDDANAS